MKYITVKRFSLIDLLVVIAIIAILAGMLLPALKKALERGHTMACGSNFKQHGSSAMMYMGDYNEYVPYNQPKQNDVTGFWSYQLAPYNGRPDVNASAMTLTLKYDTFFVKGIYRCPSFTGKAESVPGYDASTWQYGAIGYGWNTLQPQTTNTGINAIKSSQIRRPSAKYFAGDGTDAGTVDWHFRGFWHPSPWAGTQDADKNIGTRHENAVNVLHADGHVARLSHSALRAHVVNDQSYYHWYLDKW